MSDWVGPNTNSCANLGECTLTSVSTPAIIDTADCLCGLQGTRETYESDSSWWRCIANVTGDINSGGTGKWFYPILPLEQGNSYTLGEFLPINSGDFPVNTTQAYVLSSDGDGGYIYVPLTAEIQDQLSAADLACTGSNDTKWSTQYYAAQDGPSPSSTSSQTGLYTSTSAGDFRPHANATATPSKTSLTSSQPTIVTSTPTSTVSAGSCLYTHRSTVRALMLFAVTGFGLSPWASLRLAPP